MYRASTKYQANYPQQNCGALKFEAYFHVVIPAPFKYGVNSSRNPVFPSFSGLPPTRE